MNAVPSLSYRCSLCGCSASPCVFYPGASLREARCTKCGASRRTRDLVSVLLSEFSHEPDVYLDPEASFLQGLAIYELQAQGPLHARLKTLPGYTCSEYYPFISPGLRNEQGILCQDAQALTFPDTVFDLVISQDVMEHVTDPWRAFAEIHRVLKPGGRHIFTVPLHEGRETRQRAESGLHGLCHLLPPVFHKDPLNKDGSLVFWDFGEDLPMILERRGIPTKVGIHTVLYGADELCTVESVQDYENYLKARSDNTIASFFLYNSIVLISRRAV